MAAIKLSFVSVAVWWLVFSIPVLRRVPEPRAALEADETGRENALVVAFRRVWETFHELRQYGPYRVVVGPSCGAYEYMSEPIVLTAGQVSTLTIEVPA